MDWFKFFWDEGSVAFNLDEYESLRLAVIKRLGEVGFIQFYMKKLLGITDEEARFIVSDEHNNSKLVEV